MKKALIKVVKANKTGAKAKTENAVSDPHAERDIHRNIADIVNIWISERRENRLAEKIFSDERISAWKSALRP